MISQMMVTTMAHEAPMERGRMGHLNVPPNPNQERIHGQGKYVTPGHSDAFLPTLPDGFLMEPKKKNSRHVNEDPGVELSPHYAIPNMILDLLNTSLGLEIKHETGRRISLKVSPKRLTRSRNQLQRV